jgi:hypothetical protein
MRFSICTVLACLALSACGNDPAPAGGASIGPVDLTKSPATLGLSCAGVTTTVALEMPCLIGMNLAGSAATGPGNHAVECHAAQAGDPVVWSFVLPLGTIARDPNVVLAVPGQTPSVPATGGAIMVGGEPLRVSGVTGSLSFTRVDPDARAFEGAFAGTVKLKGSTSGTEVTCAVDGPFWGAPGGFI